MINLRLNDNVFNSEISDSHSSLKRLGFSFTEKFQRKER